MAYGSTSRRRSAPIGRIKPGRGFNNFPAIAAAFPDVIGDIISETGTEVLMGSVARAPEDTGTLKASGKLTLYHRGPDGAVSSARIDFKAKDVEPSDKAHAYAYYVEVGSIHGAAQPFVVPTVMEQRPLFIEQLHALESRLPR